MEKSLIVCLLAGYSGNLNFYSLLVLGEEGRAKCVKMQLAGRGNGSESLGNEREMGKKDA